MKRATLGLLAAAVLLFACGPPSPQAPARSAPGGAPALASAPPPALPPTDAAAYRQQVVDGARAEGEANILLSGIWTAEALEQVLDAVEREYGVRLKVNRTPSTNYGAHAATLISELGANATLSYDVHQSSDSSSASLLQAEALEPVNWQALLPTGTPPEVIQGDGRLLATYTGFNGHMYDPSVMPESDLPRSLRDLANPRWRGRIMLTSSPDIFVFYAYKWGRDDLLATLRAVMDNGTTTGTFFQQQTRYVAKEVAMVQVSSIIFASARTQGIPGSYTLLDFGVDSAHHLSVPRRAAHPNAAKVIAATITGPEGQRIAHGAGGPAHRGRVHRRREPVLHRLPGAAPNGSGAGRGVASHVLAQRAGRARFPALARRRRPEA